MKEEILSSKLKNYHLVKISKTNIAKLFELYIDENNGLVTPIPISAMVNQYLKNKIEEDNENRYQTRSI